MAETKMRPRCQPPEIETLKIFVETRLRQDIGKTTILACPQVKYRR